MVIAPDSEILCAFPSDVGTGGAAQRPGRCQALHADGYTGSTLREALTAQYDGSWRRDHWGAAQYNEVSCSCGRAVAMGVRELGGTLLLRTRCRVWAARIQCGVEQHDNRDIVVLL
jgi:hypothetical protein